MERRILFKLQSPAKDMVARRALTDMFGTSTELVMKLGEVVSCVTQGNSETFVCEKSVCWIGKVWHPIKVCAGISIRIRTRNWRLCSAESTRKCSRTEDWACGWRPATFGGDIPITKRWFPRSFVELTQANDFHSADSPLEVGSAQQGAFWILAMELSCRPPALSGAFYPQVWLTTSRFTNNWLINMVALRQMKDFHPFGNRSATCFPSPRKSGTPTFDVLVPNFMNFVITTIAWKPAMSLPIRLCCLSASPDKRKPLLMPHFKWSSQSYPPDRKLSASEELRKEVEHQESMALFLKSCNKPSLRTRMS